MYRNRSIRSIRTFRGARATSLLFLCQIVHREFPRHERCGVGRWNLFDCANELGQFITNVHIRDGFSVECRCDGAIAVVGIASSTQDKGRSIGLGKILYVIRKPGCGADANNQNPGRTRVERAGMTDFGPGREPDLHMIHHIARRDAGRFIEDKKAVHSSSICKSKATYERIMELKDGADLSLVSWCFERSRKR